MPLNFENECSFAGPALPEPFVKLELEAELRRQDLLPKETGEEGKKLLERWELLRTKLRKLVVTGGAVRVQNHVLDPLVELLGYTTMEDGGEIATEEEMENGGLVLRNGVPNAKLRVWATDLDGDLDAPEERGLASRFSAAQKAERVLRATGEKLGLLTNGSELRVIISDPGRVSSSVSIALDPHWKRSREIPDSLRLLIALASPTGLMALPGLIEKARLQQAKVTKDLRRQAREAIEQFIQEVLDHPSNKARFEASQDKNTLAKDLWHEGLILIYRLLFVLKLEATDDPARTFKFAASSLWRHSFSPSAALAPFARKVLDEGAETGQLLEQGMRALFRMLGEGLQATELNAKPVGGALFAPNTTPILSEAHWGERAVACLLDRLLWTTPNKGGPRQRVHYGPLDVEDLGRVYEALLELEPGISSEPMCRLRRSKLEVVVPIAQGKKYRPKLADVANGSEKEDAEEEEDEDNVKKTKVLWIEEIKPGRFYLRVGLGRKASGSFYTPHSFVRFLVKEVLGKLVERVSPLNNPNPCSILLIKLIDKAMGSGHFLVEACRFLGEQLYEAARRCDEMALELEKKAENYKLSTQEKKDLLDKAAEYRKRVVDLPDPDDEMLQYLPSRAPEGRDSGYSMSRAKALSRRMIAVHCIYGVDRNKLAVELAKLALWIECHAEGLPLTFLDHRLVVGDSLTGPFFEQLLKFPGTQQQMEDLFTRGLTGQLAAKLGKSLEHVRELEKSVGVTLAEIKAKEAAKARLDKELAPFKILAAAWCGGVMLGTEACDDTAYAALAKLIAETGRLPEDWLTAISGRTSPALLRMIAKGLGLPAIAGDDANFQSLIARLSANAVPVLSFDLAFPEVFYPDANPANRVGFGADLGNPPWEGIDTSNKEFFAAFDFSILELRTDDEIKALIKRLMSDPVIESLRSTYEADIEGLKRAIRVLLTQVNQSGTGGSAATPDLYQCFVERGSQILAARGCLGMVLPSALHANEGAAGIRSLLIEQMSLRECFSFENKRRLFEIHASMKFATIVADKTAKKGEKFRCAFYLLDDEWLFAADRKPPELEYDLSFLRTVTGNALNFPELRRPTDVPPFLACYEHKTTTFGSLRRMVGVMPSEELHKSKQRWRFVLASSVLSDGDDPRDPKVAEALRAKGYLPLIEGSTFHQFTDHWEERPEYIVPLDKLADKRARLESARTFRVAFRWVASSTNERTAIFNLLPPGGVFANNALVESRALERRSCDALLICALANSFPFDWLLRQFVAANVQFNFLDPLPVPTIQVQPRNGFLAHCALRLTCNHAGYAPLWREQLGVAWREPGKAFMWPVLAEDDDRWAARAAIDAVVAQAYGLTREQYKHVLSSFSHTSYKKAPELCSAGFDDLTKLGVEAFCKKCDPYWDVPTNENLPQPVIDLLIPELECQKQNELEFAGILKATKGKKQVRK